MNFNKVILMGRLTRDPELRYTPQGTPVTDLPLAVNREYVTANNERRKDTAFVDVTFWRRRAEVLCQYLRKGDPILLEGHLTMDTWETPEGQRRSRLKVMGDEFRFVNRGGRDGDRGGPSEPEGDDASQYEYSGSSPRPAAQGEASWSGGGGPDSARGTDAVDDSDIPF